MKKLMFLCLSVFISTAYFSQSAESSTDLSNKKWKHGFNLSVTQSNLIYDAPVTILPVNPEPRITNSLGFGLGLNTEYKATNHLSARVSAGLAFNGGYFTYTVSENGEPLYEKDQEFLPVTLDGGIHGILYLKETGTSPYVVFGITGRIPVDKSDESTEISASNGFISADLGIGLNKAFSHYNFSPELRYSYALQGLTHVLFPDKTNMHQISLIIGLNG